jgi:hypothetical protein
VLSTVRHRDPKHVMSYLTEKTHLPWVAAVLFTGSPPWLAQAAAPDATLGPLVVTASINPEIKAGAPGDPQTFGVRATLMF